MTHSRLLLSYMTALLVFPSAVVGQMNLDADAAAALTAVRDAGIPSAASAVLMQEQKRRTKAELHAFADSLVAVATSPTGDDPRHHEKAAGAASLALLMAAHPGHYAERRRALEARGLAAPVAYPYAFEALETIVSSSRDPGIRSGVLYLMSQLPETDRVVSLLERLATLPDQGLSTAAVQCLSTELGEEGLAALQRLYGSNAVVDRVARDNLEALAYGNGWNRRP